MRQRLHLALLRAASWLAPAREREEWLAEWRAELWYVGPRLRTRFCLGSFRDAFWLRCHAPPAARLQSPWECLAVLAVLAGLSVFFALRLSLPREIFFSRSLPAGLVTVSGVPFDDYRQFPASYGTVAFYGLSGGALPVARASRNLFDLLQMPLSAPSEPSIAPLVLTRTGWRKHFDGDPHIVGRRVNIEGRPAEIVGVIPDTVWRLPGYADAWLLLDEPELESESRGYLLARLAPATRLVSVTRADGGVDRLHCVPLDGPSPLLMFLLIAVSALILPAVTDLSLGKYPPNPHAVSRTAAGRRWLFLAVKTVLVLPIVLFGLTDVLSLIAAALQPHAMIVGGVIGLRWILNDQRHRCPVCLRVLSNPTPIGGPSHILLEWYGTELICARGHGLLHVPEIRSSYSEPRWLHLDSSWSSLF